MAHTAFSACLHIHKRWLQPRLISLISQSSIILCIQYSNAGTEFAKAAMRNSYIDKLHYIVEAKLLLYMKTNCPLFTSSLIQLVVEKPSGWKPQSSTEYLPWMIWHISYIRGCSKHPSTKKATDADIVIHDNSNSPTSHNAAVSRIYLEAAAMQGHEGCNICYVHFYIQRRRDFS